MTASDNSKDPQKNDGENANFQTDTNMLMNLIANKNKLIDTEKRWNFNHQSGDFADLDDDPSKYINNGASNNVVHNAPNTAPINLHTGGIEPVDNVTRPQIFQKKDTFDTDTARNTDKNTEKNATNDEKPEDIMLQKLDYIRKLGELKQAGVNISTNYNLNSDLKIMKYEYELHRTIRAKQMGINWMSSMTLNLIYGIEMLNDRYNPFDLKLRDWSKEMSAEINNYYDVFGELYEKYNQPGKNMAPELKLMLMISGSALKYHLMHTLANTSTLNEYILNPATAEKLRKEAVAEKMRENTINNNSKLNDMMNKEHDQVVNKVADLQKLKEQELDFLNMEKKRAEMDELKKNLSSKQQFNPPPNPVHARQPQHSVPEAVQRMHQMMAERNTSDLNNSHQSQRVVVQNDELARQQLEYNKQINERQLNLLKMQQIGLKNKIDLETIQKLREIENTKSKSKITSDTASQLSNRSTKSEITINNNIDDILSKSKKEFDAQSVSDNQKIMQIDTVDEDDVDDKVSFGTKSNKRSLGSRISRVSNKIGKNKKKGLSIDS